MGDEQRLDRVDGLLIDIDGVLTLSWRPIPGAPDALRRIRGAGIATRLLTNTTSIPRSEIVRRLGAAGMTVDADEVLTAPVATAAWISAHHPGARCLVISSGDLADDLGTLHVVGVDQPADLVLLGGAGPEFSYAALNRALTLLLDGAPLIAMHRNRYWRTIDGFALDTGGFVAALEQASGVEATVVGKPSPEFFASALGSLGRSGDRVAMVGDDIESDVLAAQAQGLRGVLVRTGKFRPDALEAATGTPDRSLESFADLPALLGVS